MKPATGVATQVDRLFQHHQRDLDGGYELVRHLLSYRESLPEGQRKELCDALTALVITRSPGIWSVALEALVQASETRSAPQLGSLLQVKDLEPDMEDQIIRALLLLRYDGIDYEEYLGRSISERRSMAVPNLGALANIDPTRCIEMTSAYFRTKLVKGDDSRVQAAIPPLVLNWLGTDEGLLARLVEHVALSDKPLAVDLAKMIDQYLKKPWMLTRLGEAHAHRLSEQAIEAASGNPTRDGGSGRR